MNYQYIFILLILIIVIFYNYCYSNTESFVNESFRNQLLKDEHYNYIVYFYMKNDKKSIDYLFPQWKNLKEAGYDNTLFFDFEVQDGITNKILASKFNISRFPTLITFKLPKDLVNNNNTFNLQMIEDKIYDYKIYNGPLENKQILNWLKNSCGVRLKESYIEEGFGNHTSQNEKMKDDLELRYGNSKNRCQNKNIQELVLNDKHCYPAVFYKNNDSYCVDSKYSRGCIHPREIQVKEKNAAFNIFSSYLNSINIDSQLINDKGNVIPKTDNDKQTILDKCANSYKEQIHSFGLCDNQDFMNQIQNYENNVENENHLSRCKNTDFSKNKMITSAIIKACKDYKRNKEIL